MNKIPTGELVPRDLKVARIKWIHELVRTKGKGLSQHDHIKFIENEFCCPLITAFTLYADAMKELDDTSFSKEQFDMLAVNDLMIALKNPYLQPNERRRIWESIAKFKGYVSQPEVSTPVPPVANIQDAEVLEVALKLDEVIERQKARNGET